MDIERVTIAALVLYGAVITRSLLKNMRVVQAATMEVYRLRKLQSYTHRFEDDIEAK